VGGTADVTAVGLGEASVSGVGVLVNGSGTTRCTGSIVSPGFVLTSRHCDSDDLRFIINDVPIPVARRFPHPASDALLLQLADAPDPVAQGIPLIRYRAPLDPAEWNGREVTLVGFGIDESGTSGVRRYLVERVADISQEHVVVAGTPSTGACHGDSGGPLLSREAASSGQLLGVLSGGASSCRGTDRYVRIDRLEVWILDTLELAGGDLCAGFSSEGACAGSTASWCEEGRLRAEACSGKDICGYAVGLGYRCLGNEFDPCEGFGQTPSCENENVTRCQRGTLVRVDCSACGLQCALSTSGVAECN
jgi:hypothetical protein